MNFKLPIISLAIILFTTSCNNSSNQEGGYLPEAEANNTIALSFFPDNLDSAIYYLDIATKIDTTFYEAYTNKIQAYCMLGDYQNAKIENENAVRVAPEMAEAVFTLGLLQAHLGDSVSAATNYQKSIDIYSQRLQNEESTMYELNIAIAKIFLGKEEEAKAEIDEIYKKSNNSPRLEKYVNFDKDAFIRSILKIKNQTTEPITTPSDSTLVQE
jgi:tetratricopeptide (TPR) repeat protein